MSLKPAKASWSVGTDAYGRQVWLIFERTYDGKDVWQVHRYAANQRDEPATCDGLTLENLKAIGRIAEEQGR